MDSAWGNWRFKDPRLRWARKGIDFGTPELRRRKCSLEVDVLRIRDCGGPKMTGFRAPGIAKPKMINLAGKNRWPSHMGILRKNDVLRSRDYGGPEKD